MTRLVWGASGERFYETGVDRGVFFLGTNVGVPWNGLQSVTEGVTSGTPRPFYMDGIKYLNLSSFSDFEATIVSLDAPEGFDACEGRVALALGLVATEQRKRPFSFTYRSLIGNDVDGTEHGYKIHLVYNALAIPAQKQRTSLGATSEPMPLSWNVTTVPPEASGYRPTAHFVLDSRVAHPDHLAEIEDILYGSDIENSRMPDIEEVRAILSGVSPP